MDESSVETLAPPSEALEAALRRIDEISTLPQIALRVMQVANDPHSGAGDLKEVMESDAALSARVLRCVNSSAYALRTKITNLQQAIAYLGLKQIRNLAMTASVSELFAKEEMIGIYRRSQLWRHLVSVGLCARLIAMRMRFMNFEDMFLAGLLHDVGIVLEDQHVHSGFFLVIRSLSKDKTLAEVERKHMGFDHMELGERVAAAWGFPDSVKAAIRHHHNSAGYRGDQVDLVRCVEVANLLCSLKGISSVGVSLIRVSQPAIRGLGLSKQDLLVLADDLEHEIASHQNLFTM